MSKKKKPSERAKKCYISLQPYVLEYLDKMAKEMKTTRSGMITNMVLIQKSMDDNKDLNTLFTAMLKTAMKP